MKIKEVAAMSRVTIWCPPRMSVDTGAITRRPQAARDGTSRFNIPGRLFS